VGTLDFDDVDNRAATCGGHSWKQHAKCRRRTVRVADDADGAYDVDDVGNAYGVDDMDDADGEDNADVDNADDADNANNMNDMDNGNDMGDANDPYDADASRTRMSRRLRHMTRWTRRREPG
jgi:hypothetical protein